MKTNTPLRTLLIVALVGVFAFGSITVGVASSRISSQLQASILTPKKVKRGQYRLQKALKKRFVAQSIDGLTHKDSSCIFLPPETVEYRGEVVTSQLTKQVAQGEEYSVNVFVKNAGNVPWFGNPSHCAGLPFVKLGTAKERDHTSLLYNPGDPRWLAGNRIAMVEGRVEPGEIATFSFTSKAPLVDDVFKEYFQPVIEGVKWLETKQETASVSVEVGAVTDEIKKKAFYLGNAGQASSLDVSGEPVIDVNITTQHMTVKLGSTIIREYDVSTGTFNMPTPIGRFKIMNKQELRIGAKKPHYRMPFWQGFTPWGHGLHALPYLANDSGTFWEEALTHIGQRVSHGCIRLLDDDAEDLYGLTDIGWALVTHY